MILKNYGKTEEIMIIMISSHFQLTKKGGILDIGNIVEDIDQVQGQFMGIVYFDNYWFKRFLELYESYKLLHEKKFLTLQTTNFLNYLIKNDVHIQSLKYDGIFYGIG